jgi:hypothetical protein
VLPQGKAKRETTAEILAERIRWSKSNNIRASQAV